METHQQIRNLTSKLLKSVDSNLGKIKASTAGYFRTGFSKASVWTLISVAVLSGLFAILFEVQKGDHSIENAGRLAIAVIASAFGQNLQVTVPGITGLGIELGFHPTLLTLIVIIVSMVAGRNSLAISGERSSANRFSLGLGFGAALTLFVLIWALQGVFTVDKLSLDLSQSSLIASVTTFILVATSSFLGSLVHANRKPNVWAWSRKALQYFVTLYGLILLVTAFSMTVYTLVTPNFTASQPERTGGSVDLGQLIFVLVVVMAYLPNYLVMLFSAGSGATVGMSVDSQTDIANTLNQYLAAIPGNFPIGLSVNNTLGLLAEAIVLLVVAIVAAIAGVAATKKSGYTPSTGINYLGALFQASVVGLFVVYLSNFHTSWAAPAAVDNSAIAGSVQIGTSVASTAVILTLVVTASWFASKLAKTGFGQAFPRSVKFLTKQPGEDRLSRVWVWFGRISVTALTLAVVVFPITASIVNVTWANTDTPRLLGENANNILTAGDVEKAKALVGPSVKESSWLPVEALKAAAPTKSDTSVISVANLQKKPWIAGNTDATVNLKWSRGDSTASWQIPTTSKLAVSYLLIKHVTFSAANEPIYLDISVNKFLSKDNQDQLKINNVLVTPGKYAVLPGFYRVTLPGQGLIAPTDFVVVTDGSTTSYVGGTVAQIPEGGDEALNAALVKKRDACKKVADNGKATCFSATDVKNNITVSSADKPSEYFDSEKSNFKVESITCENKPTDELLSSNQVKRADDCQIKVTFDETYFKGRTVTQNLRYWNDYCYWDDYNYEYIGCWENYGVSTYEVRGAKIKKVSYTSEFSVPISAKGTLKGKKFTVK